MKILFNTFYHAFQNPGGGEVVLMKTKEALERRGIQVDLFDQWNSKFSTYGIIHEFSTLNWRNWEGYKKYGLKLAVTPVLWPEDNFPNPQKQKIKSILKNMTGQSSAEVNQWNAMRVPDIFLPTTNMEKEKIKKLYSLNESQFRVIKNGIEIVESKSNKQNTFSNQYGIKDYLLFVGRISPQKNVEKIILAALNTNNKLALIGDADKKDFQFLNNLKEKYKDKVLFINHLPHQSELLLDAYRGAKALVVASFFETCSLVGLEAGSIGIPVIMTEIGATKEVYQDYVNYVNPFDLSSIEYAIRSISSNPSGDQKLKNYIHQNFSWDRVAESLIESYKIIL